MCVIHKKIQITNFHKQKQHHTRAYIQQIHVFQITYLLWLFSMVAVVVVVVVIELVLPHPARLYPCTHKYICPLAHGRPHIIFFSSSVKGCRIFPAYHRDNKTSYSRLPSLSLYIYIDTHIFIHDVIHSQRGVLWIYLKKIYSSCSSKQLKKGLFDHPSCIYERHLGHHHLHPT